LGSWKHGPISPERRRCRGEMHDDRFNVNYSALISPREVEKAFKTLKIGKAPGFDGVLKIILKNMPRLFDLCVQIMY
jgi:hypothetical protein